MKANRLSYAYIFLLMCSTACTKKEFDDVVCQSFHHRYGVPLPADEWTQRGANGQVVTTMKDGVVATRTYDEGVLHGESTYTFPHRTICERREMYDQGVLTQEMYCSSTGLPLKQVTHFSPTRRSVVMWYDDGSPQCEEEYEKEMLVQAEYFTPNSMQETTVVNGNGTRVYRNPFGDMGYVDAIQNGQVQTRTTYHSNGTPESIIPYVNNVPEGQKRTFLPGGEPRSLEQWTKGQQHGPTTYYENGQKSAEVPFVRGERHGIEKRYRDDGQTVAEQISWVNDSRHGPSHTFIGGDKQTDWYYQDQKVNKFTYDAMRHQE